MLRVMVLVYDKSSECINFHLNTSDGYQVVERTRNSIASDQRELNPRYPKQS